MPKLDFRTSIAEIARIKGAAVTVFSDFCRISACAFAMGSREEEYHAVANNYSRDALSDLSQGFANLVKEMEQKPFTDLLGPYYLDCAAHSAKQARGEFVTPPELAEAIVRMAEDVEAVRTAGNPITVGEPAWGSGGLVLALAKLFAPASGNLLRVTAQDINPVAADMSYINLTLRGGAVEDYPWGHPSRNRLKELEEHSLASRRRRPASDVAETSGASHRAPSAPNVHRSS